MNGLSGPFFVLEVLVSFPAMKLGRLAAKHDSRTFVLAKYLHEDLPAPPERSNWGLRVNEWGMMRNDDVGCCAAAAIAHQVQTWTSHTRVRPVTPHDTAVIEFYSAISGYDPTIPETDRGAHMLDALRHWRKKGIQWPMGIYDNCGAYASVGSRNTYLVKQAVHLFGGLYVGVGLPASAEYQDVWDVPPGGPSGMGTPWTWGGHAINIVSYGPMGLACITWGRVQRMTWDFFKTYVDEAYAVFDMNWIREDGRAPNGVDSAALRSDLARL